MFHKPTSLWTITINPSVTHTDLSFLYTNSKPKQTEPDPEKSTQMGKRNNFNHSHITCNPSHFKNQLFVPKINQGKVILAATQSLIFLKQFTWTEPQNRTRIIPIHCKKTMVHKNFTLIPNYAKYVSKLILTPHYNLTQLTRSKHQSNNSHG